MMRTALWGLLLLSSTAMADFIPVLPLNHKPSWGGTRLSSGEWIILRRVEIMERGMQQANFPTRKQLHEMRKVGMGTPNVDDLTPAGSYTYKCVSPAAEKVEPPPNCTLSYMERVELSDNWAGECRDGAPAFERETPAPHAIRFTQTYNVPGEMYQFVLRYDAKRIGEKCGRNRGSTLFP